MARAWSANASASAQSSRTIATMPRSARTTGRNGTAPALVATSKACARSGSARSRSPSSRWETPSVCSMVARYGLAGLEPGHGELGVASHLRDPAATEQGLQVGQRGRHRVAVRERLRWRDHVPRRLPSVPPRPACRATPRSARRAPRRPSSARRPLRPSSHVHPAEHRVDPATGPHRLHLVQHERGRLAPRRPRPWRDRWPPPASRSPRTTAPPASAAAADELRFAPRRARRAAAPGTGGGSGTTRGGGRAGRPGGCGSPAARASGWIRSGRRPRHRAPPHMRSRIDVRVRKVTSARDSPVEELRPEVVADEPVVTGDREPGFCAWTAGPHRQRGEVEARRPALGALDEGVDVAARRRRRRRR